MSENPPGETELSPAALRAVELAGGEAMALRHPFLGTEHLVIGVAAQAEEAGGHRRWRESRAWGSSGVGSGEWARWPVAGSNAGEGRIPGWIQ